MQLALTCILKLPFWNLLANAIPFQRSPPTPRPATARNYPERPGTVSCSIWRPEDTYFKFPVTHQVVENLYKEWVTRSHIGCMKSSHSHCQREWDSCRARSDVFLIFPAILKFKILHYAPVFHQVATRRWWCRWSVCTSWCGRSW